MTDSNSYDPLKRQAHSASELKRLFTGDGRALQRLKNENPDLYGLYRKQAEALGIVAPRPSGPTRTTVIGSQINRCPKKPSGCGRR